MKKLHKILNEITQLTTNMEANYPELYRSLDENPMTLPTSQNPKMDLVVMKEYLDSLKELLESSIEKEKIKNNL